MSNARSHAAQVPAVGIPRDASILFLGALLWPSAGVDPADVLALVRDDDLGDPSSAKVLTAIRSLVERGQPVGPVLTFDEIRRSGEPSRLVADRLEAATACGAHGAALRGYGCAVLASSLRRRVESAGTALYAAANSMHEDDLGPLVERAAASVADCASRLEQLRRGGGR